MRKAPGWRRGYGPGLAGALLLALGAVSAVSAPRVVLIEEITNEY